MPSPCRTLLVLVALAPASYGQSLIHTLYGGNAIDDFGRSVAGAGDVNGDGFDDLIVGADRDDNNGTDCGSARVFSGKNGNVLYTFDGDSKFDWFGFDVSGAGDVNGDGFADLIVGAPLDDDNGMDCGGARVFSGADGSVLYDFDGDHKYDRFGTSVSGAGDVNGDGKDDLIVGAHWDDDQGVDSGSARVFSGIDGSVLYTLYGDNAIDLFGHSVGGAGDVNADGYDDVIVGAPEGSDGLPTQDGYARVFSGVDGSTLFTFDGDSIADYFGFAVSGAGDVNGDGFDDLVVSAPRDDNNGADSGSARVFSGFDGSPLYTFDGASASDQFGYSIGGGGDVNGDGFADVIVGAPLDNDHQPDWGSARVFSGCDALGTTYCSPAVPNSSGKAGVIRACGSDAVLDNRFMLSATDLPTNRFGYFILSDVQGFVPAFGGSQGALCLGGQFGRFNKQVRGSGPSGTVGIVVDLTDVPTTPPGPVMAGETWHFQAWYRDQNPSPTSNFTDAVSIMFL